MSWGVGLVISLLLLHLSIIVAPAYLTGIYAAYQAGLRLKDIDFQVPGYSLPIYGQPQPAFPGWGYAPVVGLLTEYSVITSPLSALS
jgi:hypothetical protein